ncbi:hypothetical protein B0H12DRAFT_1094481 [Mycena haematopus]|nr:hypothetical protein B0H12DRAFT_1094481 [Mycena haematopus]
MVSESKGLPSTDGPITLHFHNVTRMAAETITGRVDLNVALAQEDHLEHLRIIFKGTMNCKVTEINPESTYDGRGHTSNVHHQTILLFYKKIRLWDRGTAFPAPGSHILPCDFQFLLPKNLPASFHCDGHLHRATITYGIEVVGQRTGFSRTNRRIRRPVSVVPAASQSQLLAQESLRCGWNGPWNDFTREEKLRHGIWGDYSRARVKLTIPNMDSYPIMTAIPFSLHVETDTKLMHVSNALVDKHGKPIFPAPPALSSDVKLIIHRRTQIRVRSHTGHVEDDFVLKGSLGDVTRVAAIQHVSDEAEWIPSPGLVDKKGQGIWRRAVHFHSSVAIPHAPTSGTENVDCQNNLVVVVPFPGIGNDLRLEVPLRLHPGSACVPPPPSHGSCSTCLRKPKSEHSTRVV